MPAPSRWSLAVQPIHLPYLYQLGKELESLSNLPDGQVPLGDVWQPIFTAVATIKGLTQQGLYAPYLRSSYALSQELVSALEAVIPKNMDFNAVLHPMQIWRIKTCWNRYQIALQADLGVLVAYFIVQQGGFNTHTLVYSGEHLFPAEIPTKVPEAVFDMREAAKCIAYAVPTAAGFHIFRVLETVLRKYYAHVAGETPPESRNIGVYLNALKQKGKGNSVVLACLKQITDLHRNPLIHPEAILTMEEALATHGIVRSVMTAMLSEMPIPPQTTAAPIASGLLGEAGASV